MIPQEEFESWFSEAIGITIEEAKRRGVWDIDTLQSAFFAGITIGMASFAAERHAANRDLPDEVDTLNARMNELAIELTNLDDYKPGMIKGKGILDIYRERERMQREYTETYAKLVQLRIDK